MRVVSVFAAAFVVALVRAPVATAESAAESVPTYTKDVAPILFQNCAVCHRPGQVAPMSLLSD